MKSINVFETKISIRYSVPPGYFDELYKKVIERTVGAKESRFPVNGL